MANIRIEKKKNNPIWPWILGLLLVGLVAWGAYETFDKNEPQDKTVFIEEKASELENKVSDGLGMGNENKDIQQQSPQPEDIQSMEQQSAQTAETPAAVNEFVSFANDPQNEMADPHEYTSSGLNNLANALESVSSNVENTEISNSIDQIRNKAESIQNDSESLRHGEMVKDAFTSATNAFEQLQKEAYPEMQDQVSDLKNAANQITSKEPLLEQKEDIKSFFGESAKVLEDFSENNQNGDQEI